jgi:hypothetical protein
MEFVVSCSCGRKMTVTEGSAGARITCDCGRLVQVPKLRELRERSGGTFLGPSPEFILEQRLLHRDLEPTRCLNCGGSEYDKYRCTVTCVTARVRDRGDVSWSFFILGILLGLIVLFRHRDEREYGRDIILPLPVGLCSNCRGKVVGRDDIKELLCQVRDYKNLLEKYPEAHLSLVKSS